MRTFTFIQKNGSATLTLSALNAEDAWEELYSLIIDCADWRIEDEGGEDE